MALFFSLDSLATFVFVPRTKQTKVEVVCFTGPIARVVIPKNKILPEKLEWVRDLDHSNRTVARFVTRAVAVAVARTIIGTIFGAVLRAVTRVL
ncbi:hypothetical protein C2G38_2232813 [Gigaspora rosea]|uniref:Uncharacterized protein n=1 Tax=Gigaspora rosea TaxID=44941 RepID=A0A397TRP5_9GLOM|nr:hypothetical protein C2G38_2232813 [Gigaspora rosea]